MQDLKPLPFLTALLKAVECLDLDGDLLHAHLMEEDVNLYIVNGGSRTDHEVLLIMPRKDDSFTGSLQAAAAFINLLDTLHSEHELPGDTDEIEWAIRTCNGFHGIPEFALAFADHIPNGLPSTLDPEDSVDYIFCWGKLEDYAS